MGKRSGGYYEIMIGRGRGLDDLGERFWVYIQKEGNRIRRPPKTRRGRAEAGLIHDPKGKSKKQPCILIAARSNS